MLYDITPSGNHRERVVPPSPKLAAVGSGDGGSGGDGAVLLQRLQDFLGVAGLLEPSSQRQQQQQQGQRRRRGQQQGQQPTAGHVRLRTESGSGRSGRPGTASTSTTAAAAAPSSAAPRPYFWRLQQRLQAGGYRPGALLGGVPAAADEGGADREDYVLLWRRQVYDQVCLGGGGGGCQRFWQLVPWLGRAPAPAAVPQELAPGASIAAALRVPARQRCCLKPPQPGTMSLRFAAAAGPVG